MRRSVRSTHILPTLCAFLIATSGGDNPAQGNSSVKRENIGGAAKCAAGERALPTSGLCQREAAALLLAAGGTAPTPMDGCAWVVRETPFAMDLLLYRTLRCGKTETVLALQVGNHRSELIYKRRAGGSARDADGNPLVLAQIFTGNPDGRARALWETRDSIGDTKAAARCDLKPPYATDGLPGDALIVDVTRTQADLEREDAMPECGPLGYNPAGGSIDFWRTHQGYAWFVSMGTDIWDVDPGSFTLIGKSDSGKWKLISGTPAG